ncbi:MAG: D-glycero-beta-D-manno-heptose 1,7-bisphosphate 7-phosphatase [Neisseriaceae bacterium]|nr:D-glycero-beta-D-manno-heptose 1,7-bisphosphate 7-phosphatase [Neisseriaceae bacterium]
MKLVILDRDGVINEDRDDFVKSATEWVPLPRSADAIAFLCQFGYTVVIATNQSGIGRGLFTVHDFNQMNTKMMRIIQQAGGDIAGIWYCPHTAADECDCRKPKSGMIEDIIDRLNAEAESTYLVGDSLRDLQAISAVGGLPILVLTGKGQSTLEKYEDQLPTNTQIFDDLWGFAQAICTGNSV